MNHTGITPDQLNAVYIQFLAPSLEHQVARENYTTAQNILGRFHKRLRALLKYLEVSKKWKAMTMQKSCTSKYMLRRSSPAPWLHLQNPHHHHPNKSPFNPLHGCISPGFRFSAGILPRVPLHGFQGWLLQWERRWKLWQAKWRGLSF